MFSNSQAKGFQMTFENGWSVSVQWGPGNYCENRDTPFKEWIHPDHADCFYPQKSLTAEIAAWDENGKWYKFEHDNVKGWVKADDVLAFMNEIANK